MVRILLLRFLESYFRHRWLFLLPMVIATAAGVLFTLSAAPSYVARGRLYVEKESLLASLTSTTNDGAWWVTPAQATVNELSELVASQAFVRSVIEKTPLEEEMSANEVAMNQIFTFYRESVYFIASGDKMVEIGATTDDPALAQQFVVATMDAYVQWKLNADYQESVTAQNFFAELLQPYKDDVEAARSELVAYLRAFPEPVRGDRPADEQLEVERLRANLLRAEERLIAAQNNEENARFSQVTSESVTRQTYLVIDQPQVPATPEGSLRGLVQDLAIFAIAGVVLTVSGISAGALLDRSLRFPIDVRYGLSLPVLAMVGTSKMAPAPAAPAPARAETKPAADDAQSDASVLQPQL
jgi:capsular polysaccharide biosynthesis protein